MLLTVDKNILEYLSKHDKIFGSYASKLGPISYETYGSPFETLVRTVIGQQITNRAAESITQRVIKTFGEITPENFENATTKLLQTCGLPARKASYILGITQMANIGKLRCDDLNRLNDDEITEKLLEIKGVGIWTAQMMLIFCFGRKDVISYADFGIKHGIMNLYGLTEVTKDKFNRLTKHWIPYRTTASLYLWRAAVDHELELTYKVNHYKQTIVCN